MLHEGPTARFAVPDDPTSRLEEYWRWFALALFVLITADMITTIYAAAYAGAAAEANPLVRWALGQGIVAVTAVNLVATVVAVSFFYLLIDALESTPSPWNRYVAFSIEVWLGALIAVGLGVFANNLVVIVYGRSLVG